MSELLSCEALTKCYQKDKTALENVDLHIGFCIRHPQRLIIVGRFTDYCQQAC